MTTAAEFVPPAIGELRHWVEIQGWRCKERGHRRDYQMKCWRRDGEHLYLIWRAGTFSSEESWYASPEVERRSVANPALACNVLRTHEPTYDFSAMSDGEALNFLSGHQITWSSTLTGETSSAKIPFAISTTMSSSTMGRRFLTFAEQSFVSVALDAITEID